MSSYNQTVITSQVAQNNTQSPEYTLGGSDNAGEGPAPSESGAVTGSTQGANAPTGPAPPPEPPVDPSTVDPQPLEPSRPGTDGPPEPAAGAALDPPVHVGDRFGEIGNTEDASDPTKEVDKLGWFDYDGYVEQSGDRGYAGLLTHTQLRVEYRHGLTAAFSDQMESYRNYARGLTNRYTPYLKLEQNCQWGLGPLTPSSHNTQAGYRDKRDFMLWTTNTAVEVVAVSSDTVLHNVQAGISIGGRTIRQNTVFNAGELHKLKALVADRTVAEQYLDTTLSMCNQGDSHVAMLTIAYTRLVTLQMMTEQGISCVFESMGETLRSRVLRVPAGANSAFRQAVDAFLQFRPANMVHLPRDARSGDTEVMLYLVGCGRAIATVKRDNKDAKVLSPFDRFTPDQPFVVSPLIGNVITPEFQNGIQRFPIDVRNAESLLTRYVNENMLWEQMATARNHALAMLFSPAFSACTSLPRPYHTTDALLGTINLGDASQLNRSVLDFGDSFIGLVSAGSWMTLSMNEVLFENVVGNIEANLGVSPRSKNFYAVVDQRQDDFLIDERIGLTVFPVVEKMTGTPSTHIHQFTDSSYVKFAHSLCSGWETRPVRISSYLMTGTEPNDYRLRIPFEQSIRTRILHEEALTYREQLMVNNFCNGGDSFVTDVYATYGDFYDSNLTNERTYGADYPEGTRYSLDLLSGSPQCWRFYAEASPAEITSYTGVTEKLDPEMAKLVYSPAVLKLQAALLARRSQNRNDDLAFDDSHGHDEDDDDEDEEDEIVEHSQQANRLLHQFPPARVQPAWEIDDEEDLVSEGGESLAGPAPKVPEQTGKGEDFSEVPEPKSSKGKEVVNPQMTVATRFEEGDVCPHWCPSAGGDGEPCANCFEDTTVEDEPTDKPLEPERTQGGSRYYQVPVTNVRPDNQFVRVQGQGGKVAKPHQFKLDSRNRYDQLKFVDCKTTETEEDLGLGGGKSGLTYRERVQIDKAKRREEAAQRERQGERALAAAIAVNLVEREKILQRFPANRAEIKAVDAMFPRGKDEDLKRAIYTIGNLLAKISKMPGITEEKKSDITKFLVNGIGGKNAWAVGVTMYICMNTLSEPCYQELVESGLLTTTYEKWSSKFGAYNDLLRNRYGSGDWPHLDSDFAQCLYLAALVGRPHTEVEWETEVLKRQTEAEPIMKYTTRGFEPMDRAELKNLMLETFRSEAKFKIKKVQPFDDVYMKRMVWMKPGSMSGEKTVLDTDPALQEQLSKLGFKVKPRADKLSIAEQVNLDWMNAILEMEPVHLAKCHTKPQENAKVRSIQASAWSHYVLGTYWSMHLESTLSFKSATMNKPNHVLLSEKERRRSDSTNPNLVKVCADYPDFGATHTGEQQELVLECLYQVAIEQGFRPTAEFEKIHNWYKASFRNQWWMQPDTKQWHSAPMGMFSGVVQTTLINTGMNIVLRRHYLKTLQLMGSPITMTSNFELGDDGYNTVVSEEDANEYVSVIPLCGKSLNPVKQLVSRCGSEYLREWYLNGKIHGCAIRALAMLVSGNVESNNPSAGATRIREMYENFSTLALRHFNRQMCQWFFEDLSCYEVSKEGIARSRVLCYLYTSRAHGGLALYPINKMPYLRSQKPQDDPSDVIDDEESEEGQVARAIMASRSTNRFLGSRDYVNHVEQRYGVTWRAQGKLRAISLVAANNLMANGKSMHSEHDELLLAVQTATWNGVSWKANKDVLNGDNTMKISPREIIKQYNKVSHDDMVLLTELGQLSKILKFMDDATLDKIAMKIANQNAMTVGKVRVVMQYLSSLKGEGFDYVPRPYLSAELMGIYMNWKVVCKFSGADVTPDWLPEMAAGYRT
ncbi:RNA-dependent RNA polymerase [Botrytis cinerea botybirnavirus 2]|uniref:RNA-directed RNA polymerase n=1 Tax=Botrytis cinerea botybirnavirus 2 TaxID=2735874 RepID=A0A858YCJ4_9VIRU|nr:RNA-dependent RNA polymerase [Botrytis cinerea botybirnavirus 2]